jgi:hypothetical protein
VDERVTFKIDAPSMVVALIQFTQQSGLQLMFPVEEASRITPRKVQGAYTSRGALDLLLQDSGLRYEFVNAHTVFVTSRQLVDHRSSEAQASGAAGVGSHRRDGR